MKKACIPAIGLMMGMMMLVSCNKDKDNNTTKEAVFTASIEQHAGQGRTAIDPENGDVKWLADDQILVANENGESATFTLQSGAGTNNGTFGIAEQFDMTAPYVAAYPQTATINGTNVTFNLPDEQTLTQTGTFANGANPMVAYSTNENLMFKNLCGGLCIRLAGVDIHVSGIRITATDENEKLNGPFVADCTQSEPVLVATDGEGYDTPNCITLNCDVTLNSATAQEFFIILPVGTLAQGFTMEVLDGTEVICTKQLNTNLAQVERNTVKCLNAIQIPSTSGWHTYCTQELDNAWRSNVGTPLWGYEYPTSLMAQYAGCSLTKVALFSDVLWNAVGGNYTCYVYKGGSNPDEGTLAASITVDVPFSQNAWCEYDLNNAVYVTGTEPIWVIWTKNEYDNYDYPAGCSTEPTQYGNWYNNGRDGWQHWDTDSFGDVCWTMQNYFADASGRSFVLYPDDNHLSVEQHNTTPVRSGNDPIVSSVRDYYRK